MTIMNRRKHPQVLPKVLVDQYLLGIMYNPTDPLQAQNLNHSFLPTELLLPRLPAHIQMPKQFM